jgi:hypothetical protein
MAARPRPVRPRNERSGHLRGRGHTPREHQARRLRCRGGERRDRARTPSPRRRALARRRGVAHRSVVTVVPPSGLALPPSWRGAPLVLSRAPLMYRPTRPVKRSAIPARRSRRSSEERLRETLLRMPASQGAVKLMLVPFPSSQTRILSGRSSATSGTATTRPPGARMRPMIVGRTVFGLRGLMTLDSR